jgi:hypothetical protein
VLSSTALLLASPPAAAQAVTGGESYPPAQPPRPVVQANRPWLPESGEPASSWQQLPLAVALETRTVWPQSSADERLAGKRAPTSAGVSVQGDPLRIRDKLVLRLDLGWVASSTSSSQDGSPLSQNLDTNLLLLGASLRYQIWRWLAPFARVAGGPGWDSLTVVDMHDREAFVQGSLGGGVFLRTPGIGHSPGGTPLFGLVGQVEAGYALATGSDFSLHVSPPPGIATPIATSAVALGHVGRSSPYLRVSLGLAF